MILRSSRKEHKLIQSNRKPYPQKTQYHSGAAVPSSLDKIKTSQSANKVNHIANQSTRSLHFHRRPLSGDLSRRRSVHSRRDRRQDNPQEYPDLDFHHTFGSYLTRRNPISRSVNPEIAAHWDLLTQSPPCCSIAFTISATGTVIFSASFSQRS